MQPGGFEIRVNYHSGRVDLCHAVRVRRLGLRVPVHPDAQRCLCGGGQLRFRSEPLIQLGQRRCRCWQGVPILHLPVPSIGVAKHSASVCQRVDLPLALSRTAVQVVPKDGASRTREGALWALSRVQRIASDSLSR